MLELNYKIITDDGIGTIALTRNWVNAHILFNAFKMRFPFEMPIGLPIRASAPSSPLVPKMRNTQSSSNNKLKFGMVTMLITTTINELLVLKVRPCPQNLPAHSCRQHTPYPSTIHLTVSSSSQLVVARLESFDRFMRQAGVPTPSAAENTLPLPSLALSASIVW